MDKLECYEALNDIANGNFKSEVSYKLLSRFIDEHFELEEQLKNLTVYELLTGREKMSNLITDTTKNLVLEKKELRKEVNQLRRKLGMSDKYRDKN